jgi:Stress responsive A/B Barrel Domain
MLRHVVLFTWKDTADAGRRAAAVGALRRLREDVGGMSALAVGEDAGLVEGNADAVLVADFPDAEAFAAYARHPVHQAVLDEHVRPWLAGRSALQFEC